MRKKVLFLCTHNSARSQMAEGLANAMFGKQLKAFSAGPSPSKVNARAIEVMKELGIDISGHHSKSVEEFRGEEFDYVVTVCDNAKDKCPFFPNAREYIHKSFEDPADTKGPDAIVLFTFRRVRDEIKEWLVTFVEAAQRQNLSQ